MRVKWNILHMAMGHGFDGRAHNGSPRKTLYVPTLLMSAPPWAFSCIISLLVSWHADRTQEKFFHIIGPVCVGILGFVISMSTLNVAGRYIALFLQASAYAGFIVFYSWISSSFPRPPAKRAVAIALINAFSQLGNVAGSYVWGLKENGYRKSYGIVLSMFGVTIVGCYAFRVVLSNLNKKLEKGEEAWDSKPDVVGHTADVVIMESGVDSIFSAKVGNEILQRGAASIFSLAPTFYYDGFRESCNGCGCVLKGPF
ncbi:hypothetical protein KVT40_005455 [Elsinoe batatas]|uniref:Uncharacterized protein n=1 Tax=Elsinoe batatas TaxID=2601811 RepID=A0A8K0L076_9PEZI|nr:hypothetical protein KVT40_005455 [Elsinoe batatas]